MNNELRMLINNLTQDIIDLYNIRIPIENINNVVMTLGGSVEESIDIYYICFAISKLRKKKIYYST